MKVDIDGNGFSAIGRLQLNQFLQALCRESGVNLHFGKHIAKPQDWRDADLVIGGDGVNSVVRQFYERDFAPRMADKMHYTPTQLAYDYMARSGRISDARLTEMAPKFMAQVMAARATEQNTSPIADPFDRACAAAKEIEFSVPEFYNCSRILHDNLAANRSGETAILCCERRVTYGELCAAAARVGNGLAAMGLGGAAAVCCCYCTTPLSMSP